MDLRMMAVSSSTQTTELSPELQEIVDNWNTRWRKKYPMELTSEVEAGGITKPEYRKREREFTHFSLNFLEAELKRTQEILNPQKSRAPHIIVEFGCGPGSSLPFHLNAMKQGYVSELYDCSDHVLSKCENAFEELQMKKYRKLIHYSSDVVKFGILQELFLEPPVGLPSRYCVLGIMLRVLQHNRKMAGAILQNIPLKLWSLGRFIIATPFAEENKLLVKNENPPLASFVLPSKFV